MIWESIYGAFNAFLSDRCDVYREIVCVSSHTHANRSDSWSVLEGGALDQTRFTKNRGPRETSYQFGSELSPTPMYSDVESDVLRKYFSLIISDESVLGVVNHVLIMIERHAAVNTLLHRRDGRYNRSRVSLVLKESLGQMVSKDPVTARNHKHLVDTPIPVKKHRWPLKEHLWKVSDRSSTRDIGLP